MKTCLYRTFSSFIKNYNLSKVDKNTLIISDIDGVFFKGIYDIREIIGVMSKNNIKSLKILLKRNSSFWILTNRNKIFRNFPFIQQIKKVLDSASKSNTKIYIGCENFLQDKLKKYALIINSKKPSKASQKVVEKGINNFKNVVYIGSKDTPFINKDFELVNRLDKQLTKKDFTYIEISLWARRIK